VTHLGRRRQRFDAKFDAAMSPVPPVCVISSWIVTFVAVEARAL